jgi:hypothetical protein
MNKNDVEALIINLNEAEHAITLKILQLCLMANMTKSLIS